MDSAVAAGGDDVEVTGRDVADDSVTGGVRVSTLPTMALLPGLLLGLGPLVLAGPVPAEGTASTIVRPVDLIEDFVSSGPDERDWLLEQLTEAAPEDQLIAAIQQRLDRHERTIGRGGAHSKLEKLAVAREKLDALRKDFFDIVEDQERYFTPYKRPQVTAEREAEYRRTQKEVERIVRELETVWDKTRAVKLNKKVRASIEDVQWTLLKLEEARRGAETPEWIRPWMTGIDHELEVVGLAEFGVNAKERERFARWRKVRALNQQRGQAALKDRKGDKQARPDRAALDQVLVTNDYRVLLGRRPLLWNPKLQFAARGHSDYMARNGVLSHYEEKDPERREPNQRARLAGYDHFQAENCSFGLPAPEAAHKAWTTSPGHHRNIVFASHTEMAAGLSGAYWTQKFGRRQVDLDAEEGAESTGGRGR